MSMSSFRSPFVAIMLAVVFSIIVFAVATAVADDVGEGDTPDPKGPGLWSQPDPPAFVSSVARVVWLDFSCTLIFIG